MVQPQPQILDAVLDNTTLPHQPYVIISDEPTFSGVPLMREMIKRSMARGNPILLVTVLREPSVYIPREVIKGGQSLEVIDLTDHIPGYDSSADMRAIEADILSAAKRMGPKVEIYIDAIDVLAEDYTSAGALHLVRSLLKLIKAYKAPSRLTLLSSPESALHPHLLPPTLSSALTQLTPHPLPLLSSLSTAYLAPISPEPRFLDLSAMARERGVGERMAWLGDAPVGDWAAKGKAKDVGKDGEGLAAVEVVLRKATGGAKGMSRSLEGLVNRSSADSGSLSQETDPHSIDLLVRPLGDIVDLTPFSRSASTGSQHPPSTQQDNASHTALNLPFNLSLTDDQRKRRDQVPIPYVHEGEGVELGWEEEEEDEDDEEI